jgi:hypothetical protein
MVKARIIDPTKVVRLALQGAASIAALLITTEAMVAEKPEAAPWLERSARRSPRVGWRGVVRKPHLGPLLPSGCGAAASIVARSRTIDGDGESS